MAQLFKSVSNAAKSLKEGLELEKLKNEKKSLKQSHQDALKDFEDRQAFAMEMEALLLIISAYELNLKSYEAKLLALPVVELEVTAEAGADSTSSEKPKSSNEQAKPLNLRTFYTRTIETLATTIGALREDVTALRAAAGDISSSKMEQATTKYERNLKQIDDRLTVLREKKK